MPIAKWKQFSDEELKSIVMESTSFTQVLQKLGYSSNSGSVAENLKKVFEQKHIDYSHFKGHAWNKNITKHEEELTDFGVTSWSLIKEKLFQEREYKCECCGISTWNNQKLILQVHHIDGNHNNNTRNNLQILCPNCHSQTENWTFKKNKNNVSDEEFLDALRNTANICQACRMVGLTPNQNNYKRARKLSEEAKL